MENQGARNRSEEMYALLLDIKEGRAPLSSKPLDLRGVSFAGRDLSGMDLSTVDLSGADLNGADLSNAKLFKANLSHAALLNANLRGAELSGADLTEAILEEADASNAGLGMACLKRARLFRCNLSGATLSLADLEGADVRNGRLENSRIREACLANADFTGADLRGADLAMSRLDGAVFNNADMRETRLRLVKGFEHADWIGVDIRNVNFAGAYRLRRFVMDQNYIKEFRKAGKLAAFLYYLWWITSDCGRSMFRWCVCIFALMVVFAWLYTLVDVDYGDHPTFLSPLYYSVVTLTTLGYGDVKPASVGAQVVAMMEVVTGYMMLGGLLSIFSNKIARRAD